MVHFDDLPDDVVSVILRQFNIKEAVATSLISESWYDKWRRCMPVLHLDRELNLSRHAIDSILLLYARHPIELTLYSTHSQRNIDKWLLSISVRTGSLERLELSFMDRILHSRMLKANYRKLEKLRIKGCTIPKFPDKSTITNKLTILHFQDVIFRHKGDLNDIIKSCNLLTEFMGIGITNTGSLCVKKDFKLFRLGTDDCEGITIEGKVEMLMLNLYSDPDGLVRCAVTKLYKNLKITDFLYLSPELMMELVSQGFPRWKYNPFDEVKSLVLRFSLVDNVEIENAAQFLMTKGIPKVKKLVIRGNSCSNNNPSYENDEFGPGIEFWQSCHSDDMFGEVRKLDLKNFHLQVPELNFVKFVLSKALNLEEVTIMTSRWDPEAQREAVEHLRTTTSVKISLVLTRRGAIRVLSALFSQQICTRANT